ncbi:hypothetical protein RCH10_004721 [Variovorax sp. GrIS 2.14]|uniref:hypothetical protein n=1 Tax=Variovorax sp. GrIS 2.14 TaxID=3071709 RepID=UPI0038F6AC5B
MYAHDIETKFRDAGPAATALTDYLDTHPALRGFLWIFERGTVSSNGRTRAWAEYLQDAAADDPTRKRVAVTVIESAAGDWHAGHTVTWAELYTAHNRSK